MHISSEKILKATITTCSVLILLLPLLVTKSTMFSFIFPKIIFFQVFVSVAAISWILLALKNPVHRPQWKHPLHFMPLVFLGILLGTSATGVNFSNSLWSSQERVLGIITLFHFYAWFLILCSVYKTQNQWRTLFLTSCCVSIVVFILGFSGGITFYMQSTIGNQLFLGTYALLHFFLSLILIFYEKKKWIKIFSLITGICALATIFFTGERTSLMVLLLGIFLMPLLLLFYNNSLKIRLFGVAAYLFFALIGISIFWFSTPQGMQVGQKVLPYIIQKTLYRFPDGLRDRMAIWSIGIEGFKERPVLGWGWENFDVIFNKYADPKKMSSTYTREPWYDRSHNQIIDILALSGIVGFFAYCMLWITIFFFLIRIFFREQDIHKRLAIGFLAIAFLAYFVQNLSNFDTPTSLILFYVLLAFLFFLTQQGKTVSDVQRNGVPNKQLIMIAPFIIIFFIGSAVYTSIVPFIKSQLAVQAREHIIQGKFDEGLAVYKKAVKGNSFTNREIRQTAVNAFISSLQQQKMNDDQQKKWIPFLSEEIEKNIKEYPQDVRQYLIGSLVYRAAHKFDAQAIVRADELMKYALELSPRRIDVFYEYSQVLAQQKKYSESLKWAQQAVDISQTKEQRSEALKNKIGIDIRAKEWVVAANEIREADEYGAFISEKEPRALLLFASQISKPADKEIIEQIMPVYDQALIRNVLVNIWASKILLYYKAEEQEKLQKSLDELKQVNAEAHMRVTELLEKEEQVDSSK